MLPRIQVLIVTRRFGEYMGQTKEVYESYGYIGKCLCMRMETVAGICKRYLSRDPPHVPDRKVGHNRVKLTREQADFIGSRECLMDWVSLPLRIRV